MKAGEFVSIILRLRLDTIFAKADRFIKVLRLEMEIGQPFHRLQVIRMFFAVNLSGQGERLLSSALKLHWFVPRRGRSWPGRVIR